MAPSCATKTSEKSIVGNLVGTYPGLVELMALADRGLAHLATRKYRWKDEYGELGIDGSLVTQDGVFGWLGLPEALFRSHSERRHLSKEATP